MYVLSIIIKKGGYKESFFFYYAIVLFKDINNILGVFSSIYLIMFANTIIAAMFILYM